MGKTSPWNIKAMISLGVLLCGVLLATACAQTSAGQPPYRTVTATVSASSPEKATSTASVVVSTPTPVFPTSTPQTLPSTPTQAPAPTAMVEPPTPTQAPQPTATLPPPTPTLPPAPTPSPVPQRSSLPGSAAEGEKTFFAVGCIGCHTVKGVGGRVGPELTTVGARREAAYIRQSIEDPTAYVVPGYQPVMPSPDKMKLSAQDIDNLVAFLTHLK